ncbi:pyruvate dehydrogenase E1 component alpha subunit [Arthrobacter sp. V1I7]|uniref:thiamine pyrophosphate-dependent enzyme n=1 Tax=Arthrobacter sp. V1I7 TaxID=3042274 RepID=UPI0027814DFA|nr:thiamine pyrophosphate-dependent enzyme [Arthrobacter sp. V1I7]MDQ0823768.1 pyruvate dehydrogenase E1 component alpha subunit [Arthrobacter sp. V1I7]
MKTGTVSPIGRHELKVSQVLNESGELVGELPGIADDRLADMFRLMCLGRRLDQKAIALQRRGKLGTYPPLSGQEAASVGSAFAMNLDIDYFVPQYREQLAMFHWGLPLSTYLLNRMGHPAGADLPANGRLWPQQVALAAHLPHAVGQAWGLQLQGKPGVVLTQFGDGASNEGDFHEALNIAGVHNVPVVFVCQNNGWAISIPWEKQSAATSVAQRAAGYGFPGVTVDGNDVFAVYAAVAQARARAERGEGPTLIEARCTRMGAHSTADDPTRYVPADYVAEAERRDPIKRFRIWLASRGLWDDDREQLCIQWCDEQIEEAVRAFDATPRPDPETIFDHVVAHPDLRLRRQRDEFRKMQEKL